jgi:2-polyprenyl-3-methyl-5-hydroxy-6-metoxy-1,4-benzoquinol methylase
MSFFNRVHAKLHRPERGWDPIPHAYAKEYAKRESINVNDQLLDHLEDWVEGFPGKRVIDLGGGPGHYAVEFAKRGAAVTWYDVSARYREIAMELAEMHQVTIAFSLGYLDEAARQFPETFDLVFNRISWYYGMGDRSFSRSFFSLIRPGGAGYIDTNNSESRRTRMSAPEAVKHWLNDRWWIKIGHPFPPRGRLASLFAGMPIKRMLVDYSSASNDRIWLTKQG